LVAISSDWNIILVQSLCSFLTENQRCYCLKAA
jgi:hypothetical protein